MEKAKMGYTEKGPHLRPNVEKRASLISRIFFCFMLPFFWLGARKQLQEEDMYEPLPEHDSQTATQRLQMEWEKERRLAKAGNRPASLTRAVMRVCGWRVFSYGFFLFLEETIKLMQPVFMGMLIRYFRFDTPLTREEAYVAAAGVAITAAMCAVVHHPYFHMLMKIGLEMKVACSGIIMEKAFLFIHYIWVAPLMLIGYVVLLWREIGPSCLAGFAAIVLLTPLQGYFSRRMGRCRQMIAKRTDKRISVMNEILNGIRVIKMYAWEGAFAHVIAELRRKELGKVRELATWQSLVMGTFWASGKLVVLFAVLSFLFAGNQLTAERIFVATALYNACRLPITLFLPFGLQFLFEARVSLNRIQAFLQLDEFDDDENESRGSVKKNGGKNTQQAQSKVRLLSNGDAEKSHLLDAANLTHESETADSTADMTDERESPVVQMNNFTAVWESTTEKIAEEETKEAIRNVTLNARPGQLIAVIGAVGSGKSSLLSSILRETRRVTGSLTVRGRIAYASQDAWIFSGTVRENILFGEEFDQKRYDETVTICALNKDLAQLPDGDRSLVGDRGASLSGGQKARVALARAVYRNADIYLLDDPLSAVDAAVGRYLFEKCIAGHLRGKIVILVTHQLQYLQRADHIIMMRDGDVVGSGPLAQVRETCADTFADILQETAQMQLSARRTISTTDSVTGSTTLSRSPQKFVHEMQLDKGGEEVVSDHDDADERDNLVDGLRDSAWNLAMAQVEEPPAVGGPGGGVAEERSVGAVQWRIYGLYTRAMSHPAICMPPLVLFVLFVQVLQNVVDWWLNKWTNAAERRNPSISQNRTLNALTPTDDADRIDFGPWLSAVPTLTDYRNVFIAMVLVLMVVSVLRCVWFRLTQVVASQRLHDSMFNSIIHARMQFFDTNPIGRILNRFSKDVNTMDENLSFVFFEFLMGTLNFIGIIVVIVALNPLVLLPTLPLLVVFYFLRVFYLASSRDVKRLEATTRSPLYSHISSILNGLITVRAFGSQRQVVDAYHGYMNVNSAAFYLTFTTSRWFAVCIDWLVAVFVAVVAFCCVLTPALMDSGEVALMLVYAVQLTGFFSWIMRQSAELQNGMVSVERIVQYSELQSEEDGAVKANATTISSQLPCDWPTHGRVEFRNVSLTYDCDGQAGRGMALHDICAHIRPQEKIGIVGRTGAGKSSLLRALFRLTEPTGTILIDGVDTATLPLHFLRKRLSIIPQDPVLFIGSLRKNLDPFTEFPDERLWQALQQVELKKAVQELPALLETHMQEGGANFSVGQRQLICLARAMLKRARILVIDEATANVDPETDALIQKTIKMQFVDSTVLTIAHRLNTIMDSDRVMVLENGRLVEFEHPHWLLQSSRSTVFASLVAETGDANATQLRQLAADAWRRKANANASRQGREPRERNNEEISSASEEEGNDEPVEGL